MDSSVNLLNNGLWLAIFASSIIGVVTLLKMYFSHISPAINPIKGAGKAIVATIPAALTTLGLIALPGTIFYMLHPDMALTMKAFPLYWVAISFAAICVLYLLAGGLLKKFVADPRTKNMIHETAQALVQQNETSTADK